jgi:hypothetical protein
MWCDEIESGFSTGKEGSLEDGKEGGFSAIGLGEKGALRESSGRMKNLPSGLLEVFERLCWTFEGIEGPEVDFCI